MKSNTRKIINELNKLDLDKTEYRIIKNLLSPLVKKLPHLIKNTNGFYFRSRICNEKNLVDKSELNAPPKELVKNFQRCNQPFEPMFYASSKRITSILECNPKEGDIIYLSQWSNNNNKVPVNHLLNHNIEHEYNNINIEQEMIISFLETIFTRKIHKTYSNSYKITAAITELCRINFKVNNGGNKYINQKVGFAYPSVFNLKDSYNTVFEKEFATKEFEIFHVMKLKILERDNDNLKYKILDTAWEFENGKIIWTNDKNQVPKLRVSKQYLQFMYWKGGAAIPVEKSEISENFLTKLMNE